MVKLKYSNAFRILYIIYIYLLNLVSANYCEFGTCEQDQYCCGDNRCCKVTNQVWYFWAGILLIVIAVLGAVCFYIRRRRNSSNNNEGYSRVLADENLYFS